MRKRLVLYAKWVIDLHFQHIVIVMDVMRGRNSVLCVLQFISTSERTSKINRQH